MASKHLFESGMSSIPLASMFFVTVVSFYNYKLCVSQSKGRH